MKTLYALLAAGLLTAPAFAQQTPVYHTLPPTTYVDARLAAAPHDETTDTLSQYLERASNGQVTVYSYNDGTSTWPLTGTNTLYLFLGSKYVIPSPVSVKGLLIAYAGKIIQDTPDTLIAAIFTINGETGLPRQQTGGAQFTTDIIDTSSTSLVLTYVPFPQPVAVSDEFAAVVQTRTGDAQPDFTVIFSNNQGDGQSENRSVVLSVQNQQLVTAYLSQAPLQINDAVINLDPIIMPVVETTTTGVDEAVTLNGLSLKGAYPSPASEKTSVRFNLDKPSFVEISVVDMTGKSVLSVRHNNLAAGEHAVELNVADLPAGSYLYTVRTSSSALASTLSIVK